MEDNMSQDSRNHNDFYLFVMVSMIVVTLLLPFVLFLPAIGDATDDREWYITLNFKETSGATDYLIFGEAPDANDGPPADGYDTPKPPAPMPPYIRAWLDDDLPEPYNTLLKDYRSLSNGYKIWNLTIQWVPSDCLSSTSITISWSNSKITTIGYDSVLLYDNSKVVANMKTEDIYIYESQAMVPHHFQIICSIESVEPSINSSLPPQTENIAPNTPSTPSGASFGYTDATFTYSTFTYDWENDKIYYLFSWGDDTDSGWLGPFNSNETCTASHSWNKTGEYAIKAKARDIYGSESTWSSPLVIKIENHTKPADTSMENTPPIARFSYLPDTPTVKDIVQFVDQSLDADGNITQQRWDFGDNNISTEQNPAHHFAVNRTYIITLTVWDDDGAINTAFRQVKVSDVTDGLSSRKNSDNETPALDSTVFVATIVMVTTIIKKLTYLKVIK